MKLTRTLTLLVSVPLAVAAGFAGLAVDASVRKADAADDLRSLVVVAEVAGRLAFELQAERSAAALALLPRPNTPGAPAGPPPADAFQRQTGATDTQAARYRETRDKLSTVPDEVSAVLAEIDKGMLGLPEVRNGVRSGRTALTATGFSYRILIANLLEYRAGVGRFGRADAGHAQDLRAVADLSKAAEAAGQLEVAVLRALGPGDHNPATQQEIIEARAAYDDALRSFAVAARPSWLSLLEHGLVGEQLARAQRLEDLVARTPVGETLRLDRTEWASAVEARIARLRAVEAQIDAEILVDVTERRDTELRWMIGEIVAVVLAVLLAAVIVIRLGRRLIRRLRALQHSAHEVAHQRLPAAVATLRDPDVLGSATPAEFAAEAAKGVEVTGKDEIAEVGAAFRTVFEEAVRLAGDLAGERAGVSAMLVNLARRGQVQTSDLLRVLDRAEEREADPERLERLYAIDHHVNLMRRTHDNLLVLGGEGSARVRDDTMLLDVVRVAAQRIKHYTRVHLPGGNVGVTVAGRATDPLAHLLAELLDNATTFSPPGSAVTVEVGVQSDHAVVHIADGGFGLQRDRRDMLNARLAGGPSVDQDAVRLMGLTVVSTLAARLGVHVTLESGAEGGTVAVVVLPATILTKLRRAGRHRAAPPEAAALGSPVGMVPPTKTTPRAMPGETPAGAAPEPGPLDTDAAFGGFGGGSGGFAAVGGPLGMNAPLGPDGLTGPVTPTPPMTPAMPTTPREPGSLGPPLSLPTVPGLTPHPYGRRPAHPAPPGPGHDSAPDSRSHAHHARFGSTPDSADPGAGHPHPGASEADPSGLGGLPRRVPRASLPDPQLTTAAAARARRPVPRHDGPRDAGRVADAMAAFASGSRDGRRPPVSRERARTEGPPSGEHRVSVDPRDATPPPQVPLHYDQRGREQK